MAKNKVSDGNILRCVAPAGGVVSGEGVLINGVFVIPATTAAAGEDFNGHIFGEWNLPKTAADTPDQFVKAYWNDTNDEVTTTSAGNSEIGVFTEARGNGDTEAYVRLNGVGI